MEIRDLQFFLSVAENSSFTTAAEKENISQSSISKAIIRLEKELGVKLFTRMHHSIALTNSGQYLYDNLSELLPGVLDVLARTASSSEKKTIRYATSIPYGCFHQPELMDVYMRQNPDINLTSGYDQTTEEIVRQMREGSVDIALMHMLSSDPDTFECRTVCQDTLYAVLPADHPLADKSSITLKDLAQENILYNSRHIEETLNFIEKNTSVHLRRECLTEGMHAGRGRVISKVSYDFGIAIFYGSDLWNFLSPGTVSISIEGIPDIPIVLAVSKNTNIKDHHLAFLEYLLEKIRPLIPSG